ncbi:MAG: hypothetical protein WCY38_03070, partial [Endomicrobiia bacterium]
RIHGILLSLGKTNVYGFDTKTTGEYLDSISQIIWDENGIRDVFKDFDNMTDEQIIQIINSFIYAQTAKNENIEGTLLNQVYDSQLSNAQNLHERFKQEVPVANVTTTEQTSQTVASEVEMSFWEKIGNFFKNLFDKIASIFTLKAFALGSEEETTEIDATTQTTKTYYLDKDNNEIDETSEDVVYKVENVIVNGVSETTITYYIDKENQIVTQNDGGRVSKMQIKVGKTFKTADGYDATVYTKSCYEIGEGLFQTQSWSETYVECNGNFYAMNFPGIESEYGLFVESIESIFKNQKVTENGFKYYSAVAVPYSKDLEKDENFKLHITDTGDIYYTYNGKEVILNYGDYYGEENLTAQDFNALTSTNENISQSVFFMPKETIISVSRDGKNVEITVNTEDIYKYVEGNITEIKGTQGEVLSTYEANEIRDSFKEIGILQDTQTNSWISTNNVKFRYGTSTNVGSDGIVTVQSSEVRNNKEFVSGKSYLGTLTGYDSEGMPIYTTTGNAISEFKGMSYDELKETLQTNNDFSEYNSYVENMDTIFKVAQNAGFEYSPSDLTAVVEYKIDSNGNPAGVTILFYADSSSPVAKVSSEGDIDFSITYKDMECGLRYSLLEGEEQVPSNFVAISGVGKLVLNLSKNTSFIELENSDGYLEARQHLKIENNFLFESQKTSNSWKEIVDFLSENGWTSTNKEILNNYDNETDRRDAFVEYLTSLESSQEITEEYAWASWMQTHLLGWLVKALEVIGVQSESITTQETQVFSKGEQEVFSYEDIKGMSSAELKMFGIPSSTITYDANGKEVSSSSLNTVSGEYVINYSNTETVTNTTGNYRTFDRIMDSQGRTLVEFEYIQQANGERKYVSATFVSYNQSSLASNSITVLINDGYMIPIKVSEYGGEKSMSVMSRKDMLSAQTIPTFGYIVKQLNSEDMSAIEFNADDLESNWDKFYTTSNDTVSIQNSIQEQINENTTSNSIVYNSGEGEIVVTVPKLSESGEPYFVEFHVYGETNANKQLIPGTAETVYKFVYDESKGYDIENYIHEGTSNPYSDAISVSNLAYQYSMGTEENGIIKGVIYQVNQDYGIAADNPLSTELAKNIEEKRGLRYIAYRSDGNPMFEVYDYAVAKIATGTGGTIISDKYYEVVVYDESNIASYGFLIDKSKFNNLEEATNAVEQNIENMKAVMSEYNGGDISNYLSNYVATHAANDIPSITKIYQSTNINSNGDIEYYYYEYDPINANADEKVNVGSRSQLYLHKYVYDKYGNYITKERADVFGDYGKEIVETFSNYGTIIIAFGVLIALSTIEKIINKKINIKKRLNRIKKLDDSLSGSDTEKTEKFLGRKSVQTRQHDIKGILSTRTTTQKIFFAVKIISLGAISIGLYFFAPVILGATLTAFAVFAPAALALGILTYEGILVVIKSWYKQKIKLLDNIDKAKQYTGDDKTNTEIAAVPEKIETINDTDVIVESIKDIKNDLQNSGDKAQLDSVQERFATAYRQLQTGNNISETSKNELEEDILSSMQEMMLERMYVVMGFDRNDPAIKGVLSKVINRSRGAILSYLKTGKLLDEEKFFVEYDLYCKEVLGLKGEELKEYTKHTLEDFILSQYIFDSFVNEKSHMTYARWSLQYLAKKYMSDGKSTDVANMINSRISKIMNYIQKGVSVKERQQQMGAIADVIFVKHNLKNKASDEVLMMLVQLEKEQKELDIFKKKLDKFISEIENLEDKDKKEQINNEYQNGLLDYAKNNLGIKASDEISEILKKTEERSIKLVTLKESLQNLVDKIDGYLEEEKATAINEVYQSKLLDNIAIKLNNVSNALKQIKSNSEVAKDKKTISMMLKEYGKLTQISNAKSTASPLLPVIFDGLFRTTDWVKKYLDTDKNGGFSPELTPYQVYKTAPDTDTRSIWLKTIDFLNITKSFTNKVYLNTTLKAPIAFQMILITIPLAIGVGVAFAPLAGIVVLGIGSLIAGAWYKIIAPFISAKLQKQSFTNYFGEPVATRQGKEFYETEQNLQSKIDKNVRLAKVTLLNSAIMTPLMVGFAFAIKNILMLGGVSFIAPLAGMTGFVGLLIGGVIWISLIKHFRNNVIPNIKKGKEISTVDKRIQQVYKDKKENTDEGKRIIAENQPILTKLNREASVQSALMSGVLTFILVLGVFASLSVSPIIATAVVFAIMSVLAVKIPKLSAFSVWKIFEKQDAQKEFDQRGLMDTGKTWKAISQVFKKELFTAFKDKDVTSNEIEAIKKSVKNLNPKMLQSIKQSLRKSGVKIGKDLTEEQLIDAILYYRYAESYNDIIKDMWGEDVLDAQERDNFMFKYTEGGTINYIGGQTSTQLDKTSIIDMIKIGVILKNNQPNYNI